MSLLEVKNLRVHFHDARPERWAVNGVSLSVEKGEIHALVGESGSGKTVTAMCISGLLPREKALREGFITLDGVEIFSSPEEELRKIQGGEMTVVFQEPMTSFDPTMRIGPQVEEGLRIHRRDLSRRERKEKALSAMRQAELADVEKVYQRYPHELSGGMLQRAMIAAAIVTEPKLLICDEPTTSLDVSIQAQILKLIRELSQQIGCAVLFISHDLHVVKRLCENVSVMQRGKIVETGNVEEVFRNPQDPYTKHLLSAIPNRKHHLIEDEETARENRERRLRQGTESGL